MQATESNGEGCISITDTAKDIQSNILDGEITNSKNTAICPICDKSYANKHSLSNHKYRYHSNRAVKNRDSTKSKIRANYRDFHISRKKGLDNSLIKLLQIHELFKDMFFHDKDINTAKIQQAAFTILLYSKFKKRKLKEKKLLYELSIANMFEAKHLLREYGNRIRKVFININPSEIKNLITNIRNGSTTVYYEELSSDRKPEMSSGSEESDSTEIKRRHTNYRDISRKREMSSASYHSNRAVKHRDSTKIKRQHANYRDISRKPEMSSESEESTMDDY